MANTPLPEDTEENSSVLGVDMSLQRQGSGQKRLLALWDVLLRPDYHARKPLHTISPLLLLFLVLPMALRDRRAWWLFILCVGPGLALAYTATLTRYLLPILPLWACGAGAVLARLESSGRHWAWLAAGVLLFQVGSNTIGETTKFLGTRPWQLLAGRETEDNWLGRNGYNSATSGIRTVQWLNQEMRLGRIPSNTTILMVGESKGETLISNYIADNSREGVSWTKELLRADGDLEQVAKSFQERRIGIIVVDAGFLNWCLKNGDVPRERLGYSLRTLRAFVDRYGTPLREIEKKYLWRVLPKATSQESS